MAEGDILIDPYENVDWDTVESHKMCVHTHPDGELGEPEDVVDVYSGNGPDSQGNTLPEDHHFTLVSVSSTGAYTDWPYDRDPQDLGAVFFPQQELRQDDHVHGLFYYADAAPSDSDRIDQIEHILDRGDQGLPAGYGTMAMLAHPTTYNDEPEDAEQYDEDFNRWSMQSPFNGIEVFSYRAQNPGDDDAVDIWDYLLERHGPRHMIWGVGGDDNRADPDYGQIGVDVNVCWTVVLLDPDDFDPDNQHQSRIEAARAVRDGQLFAQRVENYDYDDGEEVPTVPTVTEIDLDQDNREVTITAEDYDEINWISNGEVVGSGETFSWNMDHFPYFRAQLLYGNDPEGETITQPWGIDDGSLARINPDTEARINPDDYTMARR